MDAAGYNVDTGKSVFAEFNKFKINNQSNNKNPFAALNFQYHHQKRQYVRVLMECIYCLYYLLLLVVGYKEGLKRGRVSKNLFDAVYASDQFDTFFKNIGWKMKQSRPKNDGHGGVVREGGQQ